MGRISEPKDVKLFAGLMYRDSEVFKQAVKALEAAFGKVSLRSSEFNFDFTDYYNIEMGSGLKKSFIAFETPVDPGRLAEIKAVTNKLENTHSSKVNGKKQRKIKPRLH